MAVLTAVDDGQGPKKAVDVSSWFPRRTSLVRGADLPALCRCTVTRNMANGVNCLAEFTNWRVFHTYEVKELGSVRNM